MTSVAGIRVSGMTAITRMASKSEELVSKLKARSETHTNTRAATQADEDRATIARIQKGDRDAYRLLVEKYKQRAFSIAFGVLRSREDAEDVVQESFVKAYLSLPDFRGDSSFYTWLYRIVYNMAVDLKRRKGRNPVNSNSLSSQAGQNSAEDLNVIDNLSSDSVGSVPGPHEALNRKEQGHRLEQVLGTLSSEHRAVITLREIDGLSYDEIAEAVGITKGTVMSRLFYARKKLQAALLEFAPAGWRDDTEEGHDS
ncbi:MAG: sigma-70 family RNA polymerase sigma factor [Oligoflexia bacterium]|nr:sigma-70 family RNA polymerase sigma factor [Oligoflexia bacterium]